MRCAFSRLNYGSLTLRPVVLLALLSELTRLASNQRGRLHPGFRRFGRPRRRRISLQCQLGNLHWQDFHLLDHQLASLHYPVSARVKQVGNDDEECSARVQLVQAQNQLLFEVVMPFIELIRQILFASKSTRNCHALVNSLNLLADRHPTVRFCPATLVHGKLGYAQNIRYLEYCVCTLGKV